VLLGASHETADDIHRRLSVGALSVFEYTQRIAASTSLQCHSYELYSRGVVQ